MHHMKNLVALHYNTKAKEMILTRFSSGSTMAMLRGVGPGIGLLLYTPKVMLYALVGWVTIAFEYM